MRIRSFPGCCLVPALVACLACLAGGPLVRGQDLVRDFAQSFQDGQPIESLSGVAEMGPVALAGHSRIAADQVFELWTPVWSETLARFRNGKISSREGDMRLQQEWERAIMALVKDEIFFLEAEKEHSSFINAIVANAMRGGADRPRSQVTAEVRAMMERNMQQYFRMLNTEVVRESGGMIKLNKVLEQRGISFNEWQSRLRKKAFTQNYLHEILSPRTPEPGPRQVREYYAGNQDEYSMPGVVRFQHIFFSAVERGEEEAREDAATAWEMIAEGEITFDEAVARFSDDAESRARGGMETEPKARDLEREAWLSDIRNALQEETPGELGPILESPFGCHVTTLISIGPRQKIPFAEVRDDIMRKLQNARWDAETDKYFASIRKNTPIRVLQPVFPQHLSCVSQEGMPRRGPRVINTSRPEIRETTGRR